MKKILICDDEQKIREVIREYASFEGYEVCEAEDGVQAIEAVKKQDFDAIILDIMMPRIDGFTTCKEIKKIKDIPIIMLSARGEEYDKINGFELGIDDYVVKPFSPKELMLRVEAVMKRVKQGHNANARKENVVVTIDNGGLRADVTARLVFIDNERIDMSPKEYDLFFYMLENRNIALSREKLISDVWGYDFFGDVRTLDTHIKLLRKSLGRYANLIVTLRGVGYRFEG